MPWTTSVETARHCDFLVDFMAQSPERRNDTCEAPLRGSVSAANAADFGVSGQPIRFKRVAVSIMIFHADQNRKRCRLHAVGCGSCRSDRS